jgi:hypothetical protein
MEVSMADIMSILQSSYTATSANSLFSPGSKFANVDPTKWQGTWTGKDYQNQPFTFKITNVKGYRADVTFQSSAGLQEQKAFITTKNSFRIGDSSFTLTGNGVAKLATIVTDPNTGIQTENTATATRKS